MANSAWRHAVTVSRRHSPLHLDLPGSRIVARCAATSSRSVVPRRPGRCTPVRGRDGSKTKPAWILWIF